MPVYFGSGAPSVTAAHVETAFNNLRSKSPKFESMFQEMMRSGYDLQIRVVDGNALPGNSHITPPGRADIYAAFGAAGTGKGTIVFTEQVLKETNYITNYGTQANAILTLERVIAHEMAHGGDPV